MANTAQTRSQGQTLSPVKSFAQPLGSHGIYPLVSHVPRQSEQFENSEGPIELANFSRNLILHPTYTKYRFDTPFYFLPTK